MASVSGGRKGWFGRERKGAGAPLDVMAMADGFDRTLQAVEAAKAALVAAVPVSGRVRGVPLAEAIMGFEVGLVEAEAALPSWRHPMVVAEWDACAVGLREAAVRAERFRLEGSPFAYEELMAEIDDLMAPLDAFFTAEEAVDRARKRA